jgi:hypothetical protein
VIAHGATPEFLHRIWDQRVSVVVVFAVAITALLVIRAVRRDPSRI